MAAHAALAGPARNSRRNRFGRYLGRRRRGHCDRLSAPSVPNGPTACTSAGGSGSMALLIITGRVGVADPSVVAL